VTSPQRVSDDGARARGVLDLVALVPAATWGRDELGTGDMWNSNSLISWVLVSSGHRGDLVELPPHGRAPGWSAGLVAAARDAAVPDPRCVSTATAGRRRC
jgi:hypothetical protein